MKRSMQEPTFLILTALAAGPQHGYAIIADAGRIYGGVTRLQTGTLYMALDRLSSAGWSSPTGRKSPTVGYAATTASPTTARRCWPPRPNAAAPAPPSPHSD
jgi:DNA-binding PadR family transcriptional regulator